MLCLLFLVLFLFPGSEDEKRSHVGQIRRQIQVDLNHFRSPFEVYKTVGWIGLWARYDFDRC
jgi:hypothetical protein